MHSSTHTKYPKFFLTLSLGGTLVFSVLAEPGILATASQSSEPQASGLPDLHSAPAPATTASATVNSDYIAGLTYTVQHQHIVFSWRPTDDAHHYRLLTRSGADTTFKPVPGADKIKQHGFRLRIRHWDVDWINTRYQLQACRPAAQTCRVLGEVGLKPEDATRAATALWHPDLQPASEFHLRNSVALSADGDTMAWSGRAFQGQIDDNGSRLTFPVYGFFSDVLFISRRSSGQWRQEAAIRISQRFNTQVSKAIALSADGHTLAFGSSDHNTRKALADHGSHTPYGGGAVYIYTRQKGLWSKQAVLTVGVPGQSFEFGAALSLSADGRTLAVGDPHWSKEPTVSISHPNFNKLSVFHHGAVLVYALSEEGWRQQAYLTAPTKAELDRFGTSLSLSADGRTLAIGEPYDDSGHRDTAQAQDSVGSAPDPAPIVNNQASVSAAGAQAIGAAPSESPPATAVSELGDSGVVHIFIRTGQTWRLQDSLKGSDSVYEDIFGSSVSLNSDGTVLAAGAPRYSHSIAFYSRDQVDYPYRPTDFQHAGAAYLFARKNGVWTQTDKIRASAADERDGFGAAVSLSADGTTLAIGAPEEGAIGQGTHMGRPIRCQRAGAVYVYTLSEHKVIGHRRLAPLTPSPWGLYGAYTALSADASTLVTAAPGWAPPFFFLMFDGAPIEHEVVAQYQRPELQWIFVY